MEILDLHWIKNYDDPTDLCAHGHVYVRIGDEVISDKDSLDVTVSSTALYLMRTLVSNYAEGDYASQLLPCCGHFFMTDKDEDFVHIMGCSNGIDWKIVHLDDTRIKHISGSGQEAIVDKETYKEIVLGFADRVEHFYKSCLPKEIPEDEIIEKGYLALWREWRNLREIWR